MSSEQNTEEVDDNQNVMKILIATDCHLGYNEKDPIRGNDSFVAFEEILEHALINSVDFVLLGGDLFHDSNPSSYSIHKCIQLLRTYTLGDTPIMVEFLNADSDNLLENLRSTVNYYDPNMNVAIPVFSIHGNHDDPSGLGRLSAMDILAATGLVNYFGKWTDLSKIEINPYLLRKGDTQLALYGLSHIHDARLCRLFDESKVTIMKPEQDTGDWFHMLVLHQNRANRGPKNYLPETVLPDFLNLVLWGHEHDCRIIEEESPKGFFVTQPGSSVATSLSEEESLDKHVGLLLIKKDSFQIKPIKLQTVRPFVFRSIDLNNYADELSSKRNPVEHVQLIAKRHLDEMLIAAKEKENDNPKQPHLPLIRLRIIYQESEQFFNTVRFGQQYADKVANPTDIVSFSKKKIKVKDEVKPLDRLAMNAAFGNEREESSVSSIVEKYFQGVEDEANRLEILPTASLTEICRLLVENNDDDAADKMLNFYKEKCNKFLTEKMPSVDAIDSELRGFSHNWKNLHEEALRLIDQRSHIPISFDNDAAPTTASTFRENSSEDEESNPEPVATVAPKRATRGRVGVGSRGGAGSRGATASTLRENSSEDEENNPEPVVTVAPKRATRGRGGVGSRGGSRGGAGSRGASKATALSSFRTNVPAARGRATKSALDVSTITPSKPTPAAPRPSSQRNVVYIESSDSD